MEIFYLHLILSFIYLPVWSQFDYCQINCKNGEHHIACNWPNCVPKSPSCTEILTDINEFRKVILREHNRIRNLIAIGKHKNEDLPTASQMNILQYNSALEYTAQCHANICRDRPDKCRGTLHFPHVGQNIYVSHKEPLLEDFRKVVEDWYDLRKYMNIDVLRSYQFGVHGAFAQLIWASTTHIGCGRSFNYNASDPSRAFILTCNYGPAGLIKGSHVYRAGKPCSRCPHKKCDRKFRALCAAEEESMGSVEFFVDDELALSDNSNNSFSDEVASVRLGTDSQRKNYKEALKSSLFLIVLAVSINVCIPSEIFL